MVETRKIFGGGTSEDEWLGCDWLSKAPAVSSAFLLGAARRLVIVAPHPDDEILPCAGLLIQTPGEKLLIAVTDGEASHGRREPIRERLRRRRPVETALALDRLGVQATIERAGIADGRVRHAQARLRSILERLLRPTDLVVTPWRWDGHPDHEATTRAVIGAARDIGFDFVQTPIWGWHWAKPSDVEEDWRSAVRLSLSSAVLRRKRQAIAAFETQISPAFDPSRAPILSPATLSRFTRPWELYLE